MKNVTNDIDLREARKAALNLMRDAVAAREQAEKVSEKLRIEVEERKQAEEALRLSERRTRQLYEELTESEKKFRELVKYAPTAIYEIDFMTQRLCTVNDSMVILSGYTKEELLTMNPIDLMDDESKIMFLSRIEKIMKGEKPAEFVEYKIISKYGRVIDAVLNVSFKNDENGKPIGATVVGHDVTERNRAQKALKESEERFFKIFRNNPAALTILHLESATFIDINDGFSRMFGYERDELIGIRADQIDIYRNAEERAYLTDLLRRKGKIDNFEITLHKKNGAAITVLLSAELITFNDQEHVLFSLNDITERKYIEDALRESQAKLEAALSSMNDAIAISDAEGNFLHFNEAFATFHRFKNKEECAKTFSEYPGLFEVFTLDGKPAGIDTWPLACALQGGTASNIDYIIKKKDTGESWIGSYTFGPIRDNNGSVTGSVVVARDVTEKRQMEIAIKESQARYSTIFDNSPVAIALETMEEGLLWMVNAAFTRLFGYDESEVIGKTSTELKISTPEDQVVITSLFVKNGFLHDFECVRKTKSGETVELLLNQDPVTINGIRYLLTTVVDISERKRMERSISEKEKENAFLARLIEYSSQPLGVGYMDGSFGLTNKAFQDLIGYSAEELTNLTWSDNVTPPEYLEVEKHILNNLIRTGTPVRYEKEYIRKDGTRVPVELLVHVMKDREDKPQYFFSFLTDITERKQTESNLFKLIRSLRAMQKSGQLLVHATDEKKFLKDMCRVFVEDCGHRFVWIGFKENDPGKNVKPVAYAGFEENYIQGLNISWDDVPRGRGPTGTAIRTGKTVICHSMDEDPCFSPWRDEALKRGYNSSIVIPLFMNDEVFGALSIYSRLKETFSEEEQQLLIKIANDLANGVASIRLNKALLESKEDLEQKVIERTALLQKTFNDLDVEKKRFQDVLDMIPAYVALITPDWKIPFSNRIFKEKFGEINHRKCYEFLFGKSQVCDICGAREVFESSEPCSWEWIGPDGKIYQIADFPFIDSDGAKMVLEVGLDITEKKNVEKFVLSKILETEEKDRRRFASDLHDDLGPTLSAIKLQLGMLASEESVQGRNEIVSICDQLLSEGIDKMRTLANNIMPTLIESYGLETAVKSFINKIVQSCGMKFDFRSNLEGFRMDEETELHLYRIITELVNNTIKHSKATAVSLHLDLSNNQINITYSDNGVGYDFGKSPLESPGIGLQSITNRVNLLKGTIDFSNKKGRTVVEINKPVTQ